MKGRNRKLPLAIALCLSLGLGTAQGTALASDAWCGTDTWSTDANKGKLYSSVDGTTTYYDNAAAFANALSTADYGTITLGSDITNHLKDIDLAVKNNITFQWANDNFYAKSITSTNGTVTLNGYFTEKVGSVSGQNVVLPAWSTISTDSITAANKITLANNTSAAVNTISANEMELGDTTSGSSLTAGAINVAAINVTNSSYISANTIDADTLTITSGTVSTDGALNADTFTLEAGSTATANTINTKTATVTGKATANMLKADTLVLSSGTDLDGISEIVNSTDGSPITIKIGDELATAAQAKTALAKIPTSVKVKIKDADGQEIETTGANAAEEAQALKDGLNTVTAEDKTNGTSEGIEEKYLTAFENGNLDPFATNISDEAIKADNPTNTEHFNTAAKAIETFTGKVLDNGTNLEAMQNAAVSAGLLTQDEIDSAYGDETDNTRQTQLFKKLLAQKQSEYLTAAEPAKTAAGKAARAINTGKIGHTLASPARAASQAMRAISWVMSDNVHARTEELRAGSVSRAVEYGEEHDMDIWVKAAHGKTDVDNGSGFADSTVKYNLYQLGFDKKLSEKDYLGVYVSNVSGSTDFDGPYGGSVEIEHGFGAGLYGTHLLPRDQYIDYELRYGKFDAKLRGESWGTSDAGASVTYGMKLRRGRDLTITPYFTLAYDVLSTDSQTFGGNRVDVSDEKDLTGRLGVRFDYDNGFYLGAAYGRGLSGDYAARVNGYDLGAVDNDLSVGFLTAGYKHNLSPVTLLDINAEKLCLDYSGWSASGRLDVAF